MYREVNTQDDKDFLLQFWEDEKRSPKWYTESNETDDCTDESFLEFCERHRIFAINEVALLYTAEVEPHIVKIHFSVLRGNGDRVLDDLMLIRNQLFQEGVKIIFGYVLKANRPLKRLCRQLGLEFNGLTHEDRQCFAIDSRSIFTRPNMKNLVTFST